MGHAERIRKPRILTLPAIATGLTFFLNGCALAPPYPDYVLDDADPWISSIEYLPDDELQKACAFQERVLGCGNLTTGEIFVLDDPQLSDCVLRHEKSHFREVFVEQVAYHDSAAHKHWFDYFCADDTASVLH